jgi:hypothetical protein
MASPASARGWSNLAEGLRLELRGLDPPGELAGVWIDASGLPRFRVRLDAAVRARGRALVRDYEERATEMCEECGGPGLVHAGVVISVRCEDC